MTKHLLMIDDDDNLLKGLKRQYRKRYDILTANSGQDALEILKENKDICVVVSDMRMPGLSGLETLKEVRKINPDIVRIMLTGNADQQTAVDAVNEGAIFRFYNKPCDHEVLANGIDEAFRQYDMITAEKVLLEKTLAGTVKVLLDFLSFSHPEAFTRSARIRNWCSGLAKHFELKEAWRLDFAALLLPLAEIIMPQDILKKKKINEPLTPQEIESLNQAPITIQEMLGQIPRLEEVSDIVALSYVSFSNYEEGEIPMEARILRILSDLAKITTTPRPGEKAFQALISQMGEYDPKVFSILQHEMLQRRGSMTHQYEAVVVDLSKLRPGQTLLSDILSEDERVLLSHGCTLTQAHIEKLRVLSRTVEISKEIKIARLTT